MAILQDYYNIGDDGSVNISSTNWIGQSFTALTSYDITSIKVKLHRSGSPGIATLELYAEDGAGKPTGPLLASGTTNGNTLTTNTNGEWREITLDSSYAVVKDNVYVFYLKSASSGLRMRRDYTSPTYTGGAYVYTYNSGSSWVVVTGSDIIFETWGIPPLPGAPTNPSPGIDATDITLDESPLSWDASDPAADTYEIYFREQGKDWVKIGAAQAGIEYVLDFGYIDYEKTYEWRVDATNAAGTTTGTTWTFGSIIFDPPSAGTGGGGGGTGEESSPTGENNMITLRRLVVAVENKIWYEDI